MGQFGLSTRLVSPGDQESQLAALSLALGASKR